MDKVLAKRLVANTLENPFKKEDFVRLSREICKKYDASKAFAYYGTYVAEIFRQYVKGYERIATYTDPEDKKIDVLVVYLQKDSSLERARTAQRNFVARYLKDRDEKDAAIVAFVSPDVSDWRFSFVKMEYRLEKTEKGRLKAKEEFTPARRYSFLVGAQENSHTAQSRLLPLLLHDKHSPLLGEFEDAFSIEKVTDEFFEKYRNLFLEVHEALTKIVSANTKIKSEFNRKHIESADFAKKLLGQIVFLYFLQKKGWFGVERDADWGTGPKNFLRKLFNKEVVDYDNFFNDVLEPLFYKALARERDSNFYNQFKCKIPFLNGGLFDPINNYDWEHTDIAIPNELFVNSRKTAEGDVGTGILDVFDRYNFTVKEDEPLEKEVAIDPEMLGKVFEKLLEVKDRQSKGAYYTPREVVHYISQESLIYYLADELADKVSVEDISTFIKYGESAIEHEARIEEKGRETKDYSRKLPSSIRENSSLLDKMLAGVRVCDPAVGSGAFLVGMMSEIVRARRTLTAYFVDKSQRTAYEFKRQAIHNSMYGVDLDPSAVEIAKLRLWLSLVVDEDDITDVKPLPNLDYKIMQGNSLIEAYEGIKLFDEDFVLSAESDKGHIKALNGRIQIIQDEYIRLHSEGKLTPTKQAIFDNEVKQIRKQISKVESQKPAVELSMFDELNAARKKVDELQKLHLEFFDSSQKSHKDSVRKHIDELEWSLIETTLKEKENIAALSKLSKYRESNTKPFFLWKLHFSEVFREKKGFDIVVGNPPYVKEDVNRGAFENLKSSECYQGKMDLWYLFGVQGLTLLREKGVISFIATSNWISNDGASKFRNKMLSESRLLEYIDFGNHKVFSAGIQTMVFVASKDTEPPLYELRYGKLCNEKATEVELAEFLGSPFDISSSRFTKYSFSFNRADYVDQYINFLPKGIQSVIDKIGAAGQLRLNDEEIFSGIDVGQDFCSKKHLETLGGNVKVGDGIFVLSNAEKKQTDWNEKELALIKPYYTPKEIHRYLALNKNNYWVLYTTARVNKDIKSYPNIKRHLDKYQAVITSANKPYGLHRAREERAFLGPRIFSVRKCGQPSFSLVDFPCYVSRAFLIIKSERFDLKYLVGVLNSGPVRFWLQHKGKLQGNMFQIDKIPLMGIPIPCATQAQQNMIASKVDAISGRKNSDVARLEKEINAFVYGLYGLTQEEIKAIEAVGK